MFMNKKEKIFLIKEHLNHYTALNVGFDKIYSLFGGDDSEFCNSIWAAFEFSTDTLSQLIGDKGCWISWYLYDNECGKGKKTAIIGEKKIQVDSVEKLVKVIELDV